MRRITHLVERRLFVIFALAFCGWTVLAVRGTLHRLDAATLGPWIEPRSEVGQLAEAFAVLTHPVWVYAIVVGLAVWALQRRMRRLAAALALTTLALPISLLLRWLIDLPRPTSPFFDSLSYQAAGYPAAHLTATTILAWVLTTLAEARRTTSGSLLRDRLIGAGLLVAVVVDLWLLREHSLTQMVGGLLLGVTVASGALAVTGVQEILHGWAALGLPEEQSDRRAAIVYNPTKVRDFAVFRRRAEHALLEAGWKPPLWLETERDDPGHRMAREAVAAGVDLVVVAGGDGTVRVVCEELAGTGVPLALVPAGTGNLLARNLGVPLDEGDALRVGLSGVPTAVDLVRCTTDRGESVCAVMGGLGLDAQIMGSTNADLKRSIRAGAYVVAAAQQIAMKPFAFTVTADGGEPQAHTGLMALVGNVGRLQGGVSLLPAASPVDGLLDVMLAGPASPLEWARAVGGVASGEYGSGVAFSQARRVVVEASEPIAVQLDGDYEGESRTFAAEVLPGALTVVLPRDGRHPWEAAAR